jgi:hypothetical protein
MVPWDVVYEGTTVKIGGETLSKFFREKGPYAELLYLPDGELNIAPGRKVRVTVEVFE